MGWKIGEVSRRARVSVRTLHHYDEIDLVRPSARTEAGYRVYEVEDLERLREVLHFKELGFPLGDIQRLLGDPGLDRVDALRAQRALLAGKAVRIEAMLRAVEAALEAHERGETMSEHEIFGAFDPERHEEEVRERWGDTGAYRESKRRTAEYSKADWKKLGVEVAEIEQALAASLAGGVPTDSVEAMDLAERHRLHIDRWFYPCAPAMHACLGRSYIEDPRFEAHYEEIREGLAAYVAAAIEANTARSAGTGGDS